MLHERCWKDHRLTWAVFFQQESLFSFVIDQLNLHWNVSVCNAFHILVFSQSPFQDDWNWCSVSNETIENKSDRFLPQFVSSLHAWFQNADFDVLDDLLVAFSVFSSNQLQSLLSLALSYVIVYAVQSFPLSLEACLAFCHSLLKLLIQTRS
jgi:hypothetical protein